MNNTFSHSAVPSRFSTHYATNSGPAPAPEASSDLSPADIAAAGPAKKRRTRSGCLTCRRRKIKCDETHPTCQKCQTAKAECEYPDAARSICAAASSPASRANSIRSASSGKSRAAGSTSARATGSVSRYAPAPGSASAPATPLYTSFPPQTRLSDLSETVEVPSLLSTSSSTIIVKSEEPGQPDGENLLAAQQAPTPIDFDSLFGITTKDRQDVENGADATAATARFPVNYWDDQDFVNMIMLNLHEQFPQVNLSEPPMSGEYSLPGPPDLPFAPPLVPSLSSGQSSSTTLPSSVQTPSHIENGLETVSPPARPTTIQDFSPKPAIDPILQASSQVESHRRAAARNKAIPSLQELELGPPPVQSSSRMKEWAIPNKMKEAMKGMSNTRHIELLEHYFTNVVGLFNPIDHPRNPFRSFVAEHAPDSLALLHAVLALSAINQQPLSVEARAESLLYFEASVDLYVRSLQQQDDISLFILLLLSLYHAFDSGTSQPQHYSRQAQHIIKERFELLGEDYLYALPDFRFLVRFHVWYEVLANLSRKPGDLRDMGCGQYTVSVLLRVIEQWAEQEERAAGLSGVQSDYLMSGCLGIPTFFISLLNDITQLKEEQLAILQIPTENLDELGQRTRKTLAARHTHKIRDLESRIQFARPGRLIIPPIVEKEAQVHRAVSVRFFDLFRLGVSIHLLMELQGKQSNDPAIQARVVEMVNLLGNIEQNSNYNSAGIFAFFIAGAAATSHTNRSVLHRRLDSTWNSPCGNIYSLRSILDEVWQRTAEALEAGEPCPSWKDVAQARGWTLLIM